MVSAVGLGANLGNPLHTFRNAVESLRNTFHGLRVSSLFRTAPVGVDTPQADYVNAVVAGETELPPLELLDLLKRLEERSGRPRSENGLRLARTLDLDILLHGSEPIALPGLSIPHPRLPHRRFVLEPLAELLPDLVIPGLGHTVRELLAGAPPQRIQRLGSLY